MYLQSVIKWTSRDIEYDNHNWNWPFSAKSWNEFEPQDGSHAYLHVSSVSLTSAFLFSMQYIVKEQDRLSGREEQGVFLTHGMSLWCALQQ